MIITIIIVINIKNFSLSDRVSWTLHASNERLMRQACQAAHLLDTSDLCTEIYQVRAMFIPRIRA